MNKIKVTVIVSVKNEEINLPKCLKLLDDFSEIIIVDSNSTDKTPEICKEFGYRLVNFNWNGKFPKKRNWTLENILIKNEWVLFLDADEFVTKAFIEEVTEKITLNEKNGYWIYYNNFFMGKEQKFGLKMRKAALFKKNKGRFEKIEENNWSHLDMEVHEHPIIEGGVGRLKNTIIHRDYKNLQSYIDRHNAYSSWEAMRFLSLSNNTKKTLRQRIKYSLLKTGLLPYLYFIGTYIFKGGFRDGKSGFFLAIYKFSYFIQIQTKIIEIKAKI